MNSNGANTLDNEFVHHPGIMHCRLNTNPDVLFEKEQT